MKKILLTLMTTLLGLTIGAMQATAQGWTDPLKVEAVWLEDNLIVVHTSGGAGGVYSGLCREQIYR